MNSATLIPALMADRKRRRPMTREEALAELKARNAAMAAEPAPQQEFSRPVERPNAPDLPAGMSLDSITQNTEVPVKPKPEPRSPVRGVPLGVDMDAVRESNPGQLPPPPEQTAVLDRGRGEETLAISQADLAKKYENGAGPAKPTEQTEWEQAMEMPDKERRPFDMTEEEKRRNAKEPTPAAPPEGGFDDPPPEGQMEAEMRSVLNKAESGKEEVATPEAEPAVAEEAQAVEQDPNSFEAQLASYMSGKGPDRKAEQDAYYDFLSSKVDSGEITEEDRAKALDRFIVDRAKRENPAQERSPESEARGAALRRQNSIKSWVERTGQDYQTVADIYDSAAEEAKANGQDPERAGKNALVTSDTLDQAEHNDLMQRKANVQARASQYNRAMRQGIPMGMVMAIDGISNAQTEQDMMKSMIQAAAVYPAFRPMVYAVQQGQISANELRTRLAQTQMESMSALEAAKLKANAEAEANKDPVDKALDRAKDAEFSPTGVNSVVMTATQLGVPPDQQPEFIANTYSTQMQELGASILNGNPPTPENIATMKAILTRVTGGNLPSMQEFKMVFGGRISDDEAYELLDTIYGDAGVKNARGWWGWARSQGQSQIGDG